MPGCDATAAIVTLAFKRLGRGRGPQLPIEMIFFIEVVVPLIIQRTQDLLLWRRGRPVLYLLEPSCRQDRGVGESIGKFSRQALQKSSNVTHILIWK
jgi:hypothetical protein